MMLSVLFPFTLPAFSPGKLTYREAAAAAIEENIRRGSSFAGFRAFFRPFEPIMILSQ